MKKNSKNNFEKGIKNIALLSSTIIIIIVVSIVSFILIRAEIKNFKNHIKIFEKTLINKEKFYIKSIVQNLKNEIEFEKKSILNSKKQRIKTQSIIAYNLASSLNKQLKKATKKQKINSIRLGLSQISTKKEDINYFIIDTKGTLLLDTNRTEDVGINFLDFEDINGIKFINLMINSNKKIQNYFEYYWYKAKKRVTYSRHFEDLDLIIGSGSFLESSEEQLKHRLIKNINKLNLNSEAYIFVYKIEGLNNILKNNKLISQKHIIINENDLRAIKTLMINTNYKGNDYISYFSKQKLIYGIFIEDLRYFIGSGINLEYINQIVKSEKKLALKNLYSKITKLLIVVALITIVFFFLSLLFTKKIEKIFKKYKNEVLKNEQEFRLLFNYSNDAFIISELSGISFDIISYNKRALEITYYQSNELLEKDFFTLFIDLNKNDLLDKKSLFKTVKLKTKEKNIKIIELSLVLYLFGTKNLIFASLRDITERTLLKQEKQKQQKLLIQKSKMAAMGEMIGNIAHQWRQPLSQLSGLFFDIESAYIYKELDKVYLSKRVDEANDLLEYMSKTIDDFRNFFNPNSKKEEFFIQDAINSAIKILSATLKYHKIDIRIDSIFYKKIYGLKNEYSQAILNIISNAKDILVSRMIKNPRIKIYMIDERSLCIEDNAGGVNKDIIEKIFDPYFTTREQMQGTGIGLYMTKLIIEEKMQGKIEVKNSQDGAIFKVSI